MVAELEKIQYDDGGGFRAAYINDTGGMWHFHPEYELVLNIKSNGTRIVGDSVELFDQYDMVLIAGNIPHCWNYYRQNNTLPENHGIVVNFKLESFGESLLSQHELHNLKELLSEADRGLAFSIEDSREAEIFLVQMVYVKGIDEMAAMGEIIFSKKCLSCHSLDVNFKGPELGDVVKRRKAEWILNMIINPEEMISKDADAKYLFLTHAVKMVLKNVSEDDAKAVLEYLKFVNNSKKII